ncbi:MAG TPA: endonuclease/exonuclease/phosphatase family protein [Solirubrobacteraceae bacterium]|nr:endonuclease/exonuclease/phosphatase family protein [Solirubrobacteraceae bacterium]
MLVLSWNLFHGRALPAVNRSLYGEFAAKLAGWRWEVALLQEVPPWWPARLARDLEVEQRCAPTSRNALLPLRRVIAERRPELLKSNGGGCNAILARERIAEHRAVTLRSLPERRVAQLVRLRDGRRVVNFHASTRPARAEQELARLWRLALEWAGEAPLLLGGDLNLRSPRAPGGVGGPAVVHVAGHGVDHLFARGLEGIGAPRSREARRVVSPGLRLPEPESDSKSKSEPKSTSPDDPQKPLRPDRHAGPAGGRVALSDHEPLLVELALSR